VSAPASSGTTRSRPAGAARPEPLRTLLAEELAARFSEREAATSAHGEHFAHLWRLTAERAQGGKLVRPLLLLTAHRAMREATGRSWVDDAALLRLASCLELLHFAFLLHDDVIDGDVHRRGRLNLVGALSAERETGRPPRDTSAPTPEGLHWGQTGAILAGDLLLSQVHQEFARLEAPTAVRLAALDLLDEAITRTVAGEHADVALSDGMATPDLESILSAAERKTAVYSFELPLRLAALLADAPELWHASLAEAARHLGLAFQLQDDYLSTFGDPARHGKDAHSDLREGKETVIVAFARLTSAWPLVSECLGDRGLSEEEAAEAVAALRACGADRFVLGLVAEHRESLAAVLEAPSAEPLPVALRALLGELDARLVGRAA